jgi:hypothetical protein
MPSVLLVAGGLSGCDTVVYLAPDEKDAGMERDGSTVPDAAVGPDLATARCELSYDVRPIDTVSTGVITTAPLPSDPSTFTAQVDATAGGSASYGKNPFIYLDLINNKKVDITDVQAETSGSWDIAFKRWQIKLNSGTAGPGNVGAVIVADKNLVEVTTAPAGPYEVESYFDAKCMVLLDPINGLLTFLSDWYEYESGSMRLTPKKEVIVLKRRDGQGHIKVQLTAYYKGTVSGNFELSWSFLP